MTLSYEASGVRVIADLADLESIVGSRPLPVLLKSIDALDVHCERLLALSPVAVVGWHDRDGSVRAALTGGAAGFATAASPSCLRVPLPEHVQPVPGTAVATLFLVPGLGETLRVNGQVAAEVPSPTEAGANVLELEVGEAFAHCAKCIIRSELWTTTSAAAEPTVIPESGPLAGEVAALLARAPFAVLTTASDSGADASPKGDPAGFVKVLDGHRVAIPDRPGNRRTDTFRNLVDRPEIGVLALVPGEERVVELRGRAVLTDDAALRATMEVNGRQPKVAIVIDVAAARIHDAPAIADAGLWDPSQRVPADELPDMAEVFTAHVKASKARGAAARAVRAGTNARVLRSGLAHDYSRNLY